MYIYCNTENRTSFTFIVYERKIDKEAYSWKKIYSIYEGEYDLKFRYNIIIILSIQKKKMQTSRESTHTVNEWYIGQDSLSIFKKHGEKDQQKTKL
jgi:hypothetical protein